jgi:hypothetical protein
VLRALSALPAFALLVLAATWPLGAHPGSLLADVQPACRFDAIYSMWVLAWQSHALADAPWTLLDANIYWPTPHALFYGPTGVGALPLFAPVFLTTENPVLALNVTFLGGVVLTAWSLHLVVVHWTDRWLAGFVAGACFLATRWVLWSWIPTAPHHAVLYWLPLIVLLASTPATSFREAALLGAVVALQGAVDIVYVAPALFVPLGLLATVRLVNARTRAAGVRLAGALALAAIALAPLYVAALEVRLANPGLAEQTLWKHPGLPPILLPWSYLAANYPTALPAAAFALIAVGVWRRRDTAPVEAWRHAAFWTITGVVMATSPVVMWRWQTFTLPHASLPIYEVIRAPGRLGVVALIGGSLLTGLGFAACVRGASALRALTVAVVALGGMYVGYRNGLGWSDHAALPPAYVTQQPPAPDAKIGLALRNGSGPVLEVPTSVYGKLPGRHVRAMFRSIMHWRPLLNGYASYWPAGFEERMALADRLPDPDALATLRRETGLTTIVVHANEFEDPAVRDAWRAAATSGRRDLRLVGTVDGAMLFAVMPSS